MLWPPPNDRAPVRLPCECRGTVRFYLAVAFVCVVRIDVESLRCSRPHRLHSHRLVRLERLQAATERGSGASNSATNHSLPHASTGRPIAAHLPSSRHALCSAPITAARRVAGDDVLAPPARTPSQGDLRTAESVIASFRRLSEENTHLTAAPCDEESRKLRRRSDGVADTHATTWDRT